MCMYVRQRQARIALLLCGLALCSTRVQAGFPQQPPTLNPKRYASPSGKYSLFVNPSDPHGRGNAAYRLTLDGKEVWAAEKPSTLWDARVTDDGLAVGYAYSHGWRGFSAAGYKGGWGDFRVVIIDPRGKERFDQATKRERSSVPDFP